MSKTTREQFISQVQEWNVKWSRRSYFQGEQPKEFLSPEELEQYTEDFAPVGDPHAYISHRSLIGE